MNVYIQHVPNLGSTIMKIYGQHNSEKCWSRLAVMPALHPVFCWSCYCTTVGQSETILLSPGTSAAATMDLFWRQPKNQVDSWGLQLGSGISLPCLPSHLLPGSSSTHPPSPCPIMPHIESMPS